MIQPSTMNSTSHWNDIPCASRETWQFVCVKPAKGGKYYASSPGGVLSGKVGTWTCG